MEPPFNWCERASTNGRFGGARRELAFLLVASLVVVAALIVAIADDRTLALSAQQSRIIVLLGIGLGGARLVAARFLRHRGGDAGGADDEAV